MFTLPLVVVFRAARIAASVPAAVSPPVILPLNIVHADVLGVIQPCGRHPRPIGLISHRVKIIPVTTYARAPGNVSPLKLPGRRAGVGGVDQVFCARSDLISDHRLILSQRKEKIVAQPHWIRSRDYTLIRAVKCRCDVVQGSVEVLIVNKRAKCERSRALQRVARVWSEREVNAEKLAARLSVDVVASIVVEV